MDKTVKREKTAINPKGAGRSKLPENERITSAKYPLSIPIEEKNLFQEYAKKKKFTSLAEFLRVAARVYMETNP